jgi:sodium-dependent dicarboxylate transporter 2/3/5
LSKVKTFFLFFFFKRYVSDSTPAILAVFLLFILPGENIFEGRPYKHLIHWKTLQNLFPWDVLLLLGGSLAMADGFQVSFDFFKIKLQLIYF